MRPTVAHLDHSRAYGGAELALCRTVIVARDWHPEVFLPGRSPQDTDDGPFGVLDGSPATLRSSGPPQQAGLASGNGPGAVVEGMLTVVRTARALRADPAFRRATIVHANTTRSALYGALAVDRRRQAFVVHLRDLVTPESLGRFGDIALRRIVLRRADAVVANSRVTLETAWPYLRERTRSEVLQSPLGLSAAEVAPGAAPEVAPEVRAVGMVARLAPWKGQELLLRSFAEAFAGTDVRLRLVGAAQFGEDDYAEGLRRLAHTLGVADRTDLVGHVEDVAAQIESLDVCVQASLRPEPMGQNVLQYLALGRPTVVAGAGGPLEWVSDGVNGLTFAPGSQEALTAVLRRLRDDRALRSRLASGARRTPGIADDAEVARRLGAVFAGVVADRVRPEAGQRAAGT
jgi:glycosyltransferase involved in cell wall biosynthesis